MQREVHDRIPRAPRNKPNETWNESNQPCVNESFRKIPISLTENCCCSRPGTIRFALPALRHNPVLIFCRLASIA
jgi:hypothetical protein